MGSERGHEAWRSLFSCLLVCVDLLHDLDMLTRRDQATILPFLGAAANRITSAAAMGNFNLEGPITNITVAGNPRHDLSRVSMNQAII